jgi:hypothetical protein
MCEIPGRLSRGGGGRGEGDMGEEEDIARKKWEERKKAFGPAAKGKKLKGAPARGHVQ